MVCDYVSRSLPARLRRMTRMTPATFISVNQRLSRVRQFFLKIPNKLAFSVGMSLCLALVIQTVSATAYAQTVTDVDQIKSHLIESRSGVDLIFKWSFGINYIVVREGNDGQLNLVNDGPEFKSIRKTAGYFAKVAQMRFRATTPAANNTNAVIVLSSDPKILLRQQQLTGIFKSKFESKEEFTNRINSLNVGQHTQELQASNTTIVIGGVTLDPDRLQKGEMTGYTAHKFMTFMSNFTGSDIISPSVLNSTFDFDEVLNKMPPVDEAIIKLYYSNRLKHQTKFSDYADKFAAEILRSLNN